MARHVARGTPATPTNGRVTGPESADASYQNHVFVMTPRPPVTLVGGVVALDLSSINDIRAGASGVDPDEVMADVLDVIKEIREENRRVKW